jgi:hypothetical protein
MRKFDDVLFCGLVIKSGADVLKKTLRKTKKHIFPLGPSNQIYSSTRMKKVPRYFVADVTLTSPRGLTVKVLTDVTSLKQIMPPFKL